MAKRNVKLPTFHTFEKLVDSVEYHTTSLDELDELMFYSQRAERLAVGPKTMANVVKPTRAKLKKFKAEVAKYIANMEIVLDHLESNVDKE